MNKYPLWKYIMLIGVIVLALIYAMPNLYAPDPALQIVSTSPGFEMDQRTLSLATEILQENGIEYFGETISEDGRTGLIRLQNSEDQLRGQEELKVAMGSEFVVAQNRASNNPGWLESLGAESMNLGLDLSGGIHFLLEVDTQSVVLNEIEALRDLLQDQFRDEEIRFLVPSIEDDTSLIIPFQNSEAAAAGAAYVSSNFLTLSMERVEVDERPAIKLQFTEAEIRSIESEAVQKNLESLRNRVNELGVSEPLVARQGANRIVVELPGVQDSAEAKRILGKTANLEFRLIYDPIQSEGSESFPFEDGSYSRIVELERDVIVTGDLVTNASTGFDENGQPQVSITLSSEGGQAMNRATYPNVGRGMAVLFIEYKTLTTYPEDENGNPLLDERGDRIAITEQEIDKKVINVATIQSALGVSFRITGVGSQAEASELALLLRAGALAAPMKYVEERTVGPTLGAENVKAGVTSVQIGLALVMLFMIFYYRVFGVVANVALAVNLVILVAFMSLLGATLTLPGIAGIVLTLGMAVDANVLIFSRIREELKNGMPPQSAIKAGYERAFSTILDANLTTLIVAVILYSVGSGPVKGFAVTLSIGILTSMFTAIVLSRAVVNLIYGSRSKLEKIWI